MFIYLFIYNFDKHSTSIHRRCVVPMALAIHICCLQHD